MGAFAKQHFALAGTGWTGATSGLIYAGAITLTRYWVHGIPEMAGYFVGGLAGGILSVAVVRHHMASKNFERIAIDVGTLLLWAAGILIVAAALEVFVTPLLVKVFPLVFG